MNEYVIVRTQSAGVFAGEIESKEVNPAGYVLIEPMEHHLKNCSKKGFRGMGNVY